MNRGRRVLAAGILSAVVLASCGGSDDADDPVDTSAPTTVAAAEPEDDFTPAEGDEDVPLDTAAPEPATSAPVDDEGAATTDPVATEPASTDGGETGGEAQAVDVSMVEWAVEAPTEYSAGEITFTATNNGSFPHEFVVIQGDGYESLPLAEGGAVNEDELGPDTLLERTDRIGGGSSAELTVTLEPGNYVLLCNLGAGSNSHAGQGQTLDITVS